MNLDVTKSIESVPELELASFVSAFAKIPRKQISSIFTHAQLVEIVQKGLEKYRDKVQQQMMDACVGLVAQGLLDYEAELSKLLRKSYERRSNTLQS